GGVPGAEVLDHGLRVHLRLRVGGELLHGRRAAEAIGAGGELGQDLLVRVPLAQAGLERRQLRRIDLREALLPTLSCRLGAGHRKHGRARYEACNNGRVRRRPATGYDAIPTCSASAACTANGASPRSTSASSAETQRGQNWVPAFELSSESASTSGSAGR